MLSPQRRLYASVGFLLFLVLLLIIYIRLTIREREKYLALEKDTQDIANASLLIPTQKREIATLSSQIAQFSKGRVVLSSHQDFIQYIEALCSRYNIHLLQLPEESLRQEGEYTLATITMRLEGSYTGMVQVLHSIEYQDKVASISSLNLHIENVAKDLQVRKYLVADVSLSRLRPLNP